VGLTTLASGPSNASQAKNENERSRNNHNNEQHVRKTRRRSIQENSSSDPQKTLKIEQIRIDPEYKALVPRPTMAEFNLLRESLATQGQLDPLDLNEQNVVVDGHTRYDILKELGRGSVQVRIHHFSNKKEEKEFVIDRARLRRNLTPIQKVRLALPELLEEEEKGKTRQKLGKTTWVSNETEVGKSLDKVAKKYGLSGTTLYRGQYIIEHADPNQLSSLENGETTISGLFVKLKAKESREPCSSSKTEPQTYGIYSPQECPLCHKAFAKQDLKLIRIRVCAACSDELT
jgi:ParB-like chromosome segregation protein Spo0J